MEKAPQLDKPGAGIGFVGTLFARYILMPKLSRNWNWQKIFEVFENETSQILKLVESVNPEKLNIKKLVPPIRGIEDSSRFWSISDTLEHLVIVGNRVEAVAHLLAAEQQPNKIARVEDVKPQGGLPSEKVISDFKNLSLGLKNRSQSLIQTKDSAIKAKHPWFGPLNHRQWMIVMAIHQGIHRKQTEAIIYCLNNS